MLATSSTRIDGWFNRSSGQLVKHPGTTTVDVIHVGHPIPVVAVTERRAAWQASSSCTRTRRASSASGSGNGEIIAVGEANDSKPSAKNGIASVQKNAPDAAVVDLTE
jgi:hypothetical protein